VVDDRGVNVEAPLAPPPPAEPSLLDRFSNRPWLLIARDTALALGFLVVLAGSAANIAIYLDSRGAEAGVPSAASVDAGDEVPAATTNDGVTTVTDQPSVVGTSVDTSASTPPVEAAPGTYVVAAGDVLYEIAVRHGTTPQALAELNGLADPNRIEVGQVLRLPEHAPNS